MFTYFPDIHDLVHYVTPKDNLYDDYLLEWKIRKGVNNFFLQINSFNEVCWQRSQLSYLILRLGKLRTKVQKKCWVKQRSDFSRINQIILQWVHPGFLLPDSWFWLNNPQNRWKTNNQKSQNKTSQTKTQRNFFHGIGNYSHNIRLSMTKKWEYTYINFVHPWLIQVNVWQKPLHYCKVISLQLK